MWVTSSPSSPASASLYTYTQPSSLSIYPSIIYFSIQLFIYLSIYVSFHAIYHLMNLFIYLFIYAYKSIRQECLYSSDDAFCLCHYQLLQILTLNTCFLFLHLSDLSLDMKHAMYDMEVRYVIYICTYLIVCSYNMCKCITYIHTNQNLTNILTNIQMSVNCFVC